MYIDLFPFIVQHSAILRQQQTLIATNQSDFNIEAPPTRRGRIRKTRDMGEVTACICGITVATVDRTAASLVAVQCGYLGCEVGWVRIPTYTTCCYLLLYTSIIWIASTMIMHQETGVARTM